MEPELPHLGLGIVWRQTTSQSYSLTVPADTDTVAVLVVWARVGTNGIRGGIEHRIARGGDVSFKEVRVRFHRTA